jgi:hypothetical protein
MVPDKYAKCRTGMFWHVLSEPEVTEKLTTGREGLTTNDAKIRIAEFGKNELPESKKLSVFCSHSCCSAFMVFGPHD